jgi:hypothetical protein
MRPGLGEYFLSGCFRTAIVPLAIWKPMKTSCLKLELMPVDFEWHKVVLEAKN